MTAKRDFIFHCFYRAIVLFSVSSPAFAAAAAEPKPTLAPRAATPVAKATPQDPEVKKNNFSIAFGLASHRYQETSLDQYSEVALQLDAAYERQFSQLWAAELRSGISAMALSRSRTDTNESVLNLGLAANYTIPGLAKSWALKIYGGIAYERMFVTQDTFGFGNLLYPELFPKLIFSINDRSSFDFLLKFMPLAKNNLGASDHDFEAGLGFTRRLDNRRSIRVGLAYQNLDFDSGDSIRSSLYASHLTVGYLW